MISFEKESASIKISGGEDAIDIALVLRAIVDNEDIDARIDEASERVYDRYKRAWDGLYNYWIEQLENDNQFNDDSKLCKVTESSDSMKKKHYIIDDGTVVDLASYDRIHSTGDYVWGNYRDGDRLKMDVIYHGENAGDIFSKIKELLCIDEL